MDRANNFLEHEMAAGRLRRHEPRFLLLSAYSAVIGVATEPEIMRAMGVEPNLRSLAEARSELTSFLSTGCELTCGVSKGPRSGAGILELSR
ncbi:MAG: hypothetical protein GY925_29730 [Actinomycetia bacterium]|nr:hypothetical protein [Actinomycetes bacterium]